MRWESRLRGGVEKKKTSVPLSISFIEEAWICRRGAIFQRFSVKRRQVQGERESESRARGGVKNKTTKKPPVPLCTPR